MATTYTGTTYTHDSNVQVVGLPLIYATNGKNPAIAKRVFATFDQASGYTSNPDDTACAGLVHIIQKWPLYRYERWYYPNWA